MSNPFKNLSKKEWFFWIWALVIIVVSNLLSGKTDALTLSATVIGVTALVFAAKGNVWAQILMIAFSIIYGVISYRFHYWGEMITYLGMTLPMAVWSTVTWMKNPSKENGSEVEIQKLKCKHITVLILTGIMVTAAFYVILRYFDTPNIIFSTVSVTTSFFAASLTMLRSSYYALGYAANDIVLIVLWVLASMDNSAYIPVAVNFVIFFFYDMYGFVSWKKRETMQS